ncbi:mechanosensitive ion channel family protein [Brumicola blandensis]|uniref:Mechanosensitive ion channel n=1 Tax=Brumicola blandensis TaxID=3075611 RepID=A0AAW8QZF3_9ALTE|nr:mechanosensitive ion channel domain-containing protein [Alteromonas sp. W409]MDT0581519.1 mechanosensitive ion channel [Alteromonas sp. W409]
MNEWLTFLNTELFTAMGYKFTLMVVLIIPLVVFGGIWLLKQLAKFIPYILIKRGMAPDAVHLVNRVVQVIFLVVLFVTTLDLMNIPLTAFAFVSGAIAIGVGFGAQNIINNFISGWILMWERPIRIGDTLEVDSARGTVEAINTRSTRIRRVDGVHMLVPNSFLLENTVTNWTLIDTLTRTSVRVGVAYGSPVTTVRDLILEATNTLNCVLKVPAPAVFFDDFGDNALMFEVYFWMDASAESERRYARSEVRYAICKLFETHQITIAYPQRDLHLDGSLSLNINK